MSLRGHRARPRPDERGMTSVQMAVLFPAILVGLMMLTQYSLWWHAKQVAGSAAAEAVDEARVQSGSAADGERAGRRVLAQAGNLDGATVRVTRRDGYVTAEVRGWAPHLVPILGGPWAVDARSRSPVERYIPEGER